MPDLNIKTIGGNGTFEEVVAAAPPEIQTLARAARALLADVMPGITEVPWASDKRSPVMVSGRRRCPSISVTSRPLRNTLTWDSCTVPICTDPENLLEGQGVDLRHVKIRTAADLEHRAIRQLIADASRYLPKLP